MIKENWTNKNYSAEFFEKTWRNSTSIADTIRNLGYSRPGGLYPIIRNYAKMLNLSEKDFIIKDSSTLKSYNLEEILIVDSPYRSTNSLKNRLIKDNIIKYSCKECGISDWMGKTLSLHLDHINGVPSDNRLENLRLLCPNCHGQTSTYCKSNRDNPKLISLCSDCGIEISKNANRCLKCYRKSYLENIIHNDILTKEDILLKLQITEEHFIKIWYKNNSLISITKKICNNESHRNFNLIKILSKHLNLDYSHMLNFSFTTTNFKEKMEDILVKDSTFNSHNLKNLLIKNKIFNHECTNCHNSTWLENTIPLHLEHINGDHNDNRLDNLTILCMNCHSQTLTYSKKKKSNKQNSLKKKTNQRKKTNNCQDCSERISYRANRCVKCHRKNNKNRYNVSWPDDEVLIKMVKESNYSAVGRELGVSDNAVRKRINKTLDKN